MFELTIQTIILASIVIMLAGIIQGSTSFGFSLLSVPLLSLIMIPLKLIVPMLILFSFIINSVILISLRKFVNIKRIRILIIAGILGTPLGTYILKVVDENLLTLVVGILVSLFALALFFKFRIKVKNEKLMFVPVGLLSGVLSGSVSISGPPVILFFANQNIEKMEFRANLTFYFLSLQLITIPMLIINELITVKVLENTLYLLPALITGLVVGMLIGKRINEKLFKRLTLILVILMGFLLVFKGINAIIS